MPRGEPPIPPLAAGDIVVAGLNQAQRQKRRFDAVITLEDPGVRPAGRLRFHRHPAPDHLVLACEDVDDDTLGVRVATPDQVAEGLAFGARHLDSRLLVHCKHGVGRSAGLALAILADRLGPGQEQAALDRLLAIRPIASPNRVIVKYADTLLRRNGALNAVVDAWEAATPRIQYRREAKLAALRSHPHLFAWLPK